MLKFLAGLLCTGLSFYSCAQSSESINQIFQIDEAASHIRFLAADEMRGRNTGSPELDIAARYIAEQFRKFGVATLPEQDNYYQDVRLFLSKPPDEGELSYGEQTLNNAVDILFLNGQDTAFQAPLVFAGYGTKEELEKAGVAGKIVVTHTGTPDDASPAGFFLGGPKKREWVQEMGGVALIELYKSPQIPWQFVLQYLNKEQYVLEEKDEMSPLIHLWLYDPENKHLSAFQKEKTEQASLSITGTTREQVPVKNVVGVIEGTDPVLKDEYLILSAHYDHVGVKKDTYGQDSIYNGARDNAIGTTAMISAAQYFNQVPPNRSVLFLACTAEEVGLLGSQWYANHPLVPLDKMAFNLNCDGAGYNDTTLVTVIGLERTNAEEEIRSACQAYGLTAGTDPAPEQNLYDRSDNVSFAQAGIPAVNFSTGITAFDQELMKYYHQVTDEVESLNFAYLEKFFKAYLLAAGQIANMPEKPFWQEGDKYEEAGKTLYGR